MTIAFENPRRRGLPGTLFLVTVPAQRAHVLKRLLQVLQTHVAQFEELVLLVQECEPAPSPIRWRKAALASSADLTCVPFAQEPINILW